MARVFLFGLYDNKVFTRGTESNHTIVLSVANRSPQSVLYYDLSIIRVVADYVII